MDKATRHVPLVYKLLLWRKEMIVVWSFLSFLCMEMRCKMDLTQNSNLQGVAATALICPSKHLQPKVLHNWAKSYFLTINIKTKKGLFLNMIFSRIRKVKLWDLYPITVNAQPCFAGLVDFPINRQSRSDICTPAKICFEVYVEF